MGVERGSSSFRRRRHRSRHPCHRHNADLELHEWGVFIRTWADVSYYWLDKQPGAGAPVANNPMLPEPPLKNVLTAPRELLEDLPAFVIRHEKDFAPQKEFRAWNKPVIHLYGPEGLNVSVQVVTAQGKPTAYWPKPQLMVTTSWRMGSGITEVMGLKWTGTLSAKDAAQAAPVDDKHWWKIARDIPSAWIQTSGGNERFLFYEGTAVQEPVITVELTKETITLKTATTWPSARYW